MVDDALRSPSGESGDSKGKHRELARFISRRASTPIIFLINQSQVARAAQLRGSLTALADGLPIGAHCQWRTGRQTRGRLAGGCSPIALWPRILIYHGDPVCMAGSEHR